MTDSEDLIKRVHDEGWVEVSVNGSHHNFRHPSRSGRVTVPHPRRDIKLGTVRSIYRQAGWPWNRDA